MSVENKKYLGWGIVGTPAGYQYSSDGASKQLGSNFDLDQEIAGCLIDPHQNDFPLYRLSYKQGNHKVLSLSAYFPILEQGQTRSGTFFGAFIETVNCQIFENTVETLLDALWKLSEYQFQNFIDPNKRAYTQSINGVEIQAPHEELDEIAQGLTKKLMPSYLKHTPQNGDLYVHCRPREAVETLTLLLKTGAFYRYKQIFFSESQYISAQIQRKDIEQVSLQWLKIKTEDNSLWQKEIQYRESKIEKLEEEKSILTKEMQDKINQAIGNAEKKYNKEMNAHKKRAEQAEKQLEENNQFADFGKKVCELCNEQKLALDNLAPKKISDPILDKISTVNSEISSLKTSFNISRTSIERSQANNRLIAGIFGFLSVVLLTILLGNFIWERIISTDKKITLTEYNTYQEWKTQVSNLTKEKEELTKKITELGEKTVRLEAIEEKWNDCLKADKKEKEVVCKE